MVITVPSPQGMDMKYFSSCAQMGRWLARLRFAPTCLETWLYVFLSQGSWRTIPRSLSAGSGVHALWPVRCRVVFASHPSRACCRNPWGPLPSMPSRLVWVGASSCISPTCTPVFGRQFWGQRMEGRKRNHWEVTGHNAEKCMAHSRALIAVVMSKWKQQMWVHPGPSAPCRGGAVCLCNMWWLAKRLQRVYVAWIGDWKSWGTIRLGWWEEWGSGLGTSGLIYLGKSTALRTLGNNLNGLWDYVSSTFIVSLLTVWLLSGAGILRVPSHSFCSSLIQRTAVFLSWVCLAVSLIDLPG